MKKDESLGLRVTKVTKNAVKASPFSLGELVEISVGLAGKKERQVQREFLITKLLVYDKEVQEKLNTIEYIEKQLKLLDYQDKRESDKVENRREHCFIQMQNILNGRITRRNEGEYLPLMSRNQFKYLCQDTQSNPKMIYKKLPVKLKDEIEYYK